MPDDSSNSASSNASEISARVTLSALEVAAILARAGVVGSHIRVAAMGFASGPHSICAAAINESGRELGDIAALLELIGRGSLAMLIEADAGSSRAFWRTRATETAARLASAEEALTRVDAECQQIEATVAAAAK